MDNKGRNFITHFWLGVKAYAKTCGVEHIKVIGAIAHGEGIVKAYA
jgi:hypothetical protein